MSDDPKEIERDLERTRERLGQNLDALTDRMSPGTLLDEAMAYFEGSPKDFANTLGTQVKRNPLATMMVTAGLAWLSLGKGEQPGAGLLKSRDGVDYDDHDDDDADWDEDDRRRRASTTYPSDYHVSKGMSAAAPGRVYARDYSDEDREAIATYDRLETARRRISRRDDETPSTYYNRLDTAYGTELGYTRTADEDDATFRDRVREGVDAARDRAEDARARLDEANRKMRRKARDMAATARDRANDMQDTARAKAWQAKHDAREFHDENPLVSGFIAMAAGALAGAMLPTSEREREALEPLAREAEKHGVRLAEQAREHGEKLADMAERKAGDASEAVADKAEQLAAKAETYGEKVRTQASQAGKA